jgi:hypothetical protein
MLFRGRLWLSENKIGPTLRKSMPLNPAWSSTLTALLSLACPVNFRFAAKETIGLSPAQIKSIIRMAANATKIKYGGVGSWLRGNLRTLEVDLLPKLLPQTWTTSQALKTHATLQQ